MNKQTEKLIENFNKPNIHLVISRWPGNLKNSTFDGIATYTKETLTSFSDEFEARFVVLAEAERGMPSVQLINKKILVLRIFEQKNRSLYPTILKWLSKFDQIKDVVVHSEFCASGGPHLRILVIPFLFLIRLKGKTITYYAHNVIDDFSKIADHLNLKRGSLKFKLFNQSLKFYYRSLNLLVNRFVVLEETIFDRLSNFVQPQKITVLPHWIRMRKLNISKTYARVKLGISEKSKVITSFGFISYYKGSNWVTDVAVKLPDFHFMLAGGEAYSLKDQKYYQKYYKSILTKSRKLKNLTLTGFVQEKNIPLIFAASDICIFPYQDLIGGSGALSLSLSYGKLVIMSKPMFRQMKNSLVVRHALLMSELTENEVSFDLNVASFKNILKKIDNKNYLKKLQIFSTLLGQGWSYQTMVSKHYVDIFGQKAVVSENFHEAKTF